MEKGRRERPCLAQNSCLHIDLASPVASDQGNALTTPQSAHEQIVEHLEGMVTSTYASLVNLEEGTELQYVPTTSINGVKCVKLEQEEVSREVEYWNNAFLCSILRAKLLFEVIKGFIKRLWGSYEIDKILQVRRGFFLVRFQNLEDKDKVIKRGICHFDSKPLQEQCKLEWIKYGDTSSKLFFAKAKQRKLATYIYSINDANGNWVEGFDNVGKVMVEFYKRLLGHQLCTRTSTTGLRESSFPLHYVGVPIVATFGQQEILSCSGTTPLQRRTPSQP
ncbi:hypothetical protein Cgig2_008564 [Carnegiea gigantea]|uniref:DUF4283 domain-containing protein n=1 Tax=Carnegiea gigantea TaxID=171969 RepID=A0A9Q1JR94_9CARY|nr:hypothetical protein Cgig2_008564 [Carnegiea gigantea]